MSKTQHQKRMNKVVQFIECNLHEELDISYLSTIAYYSEFHFHRLFRAYVGESVYAYRKRLLLERAVKQLRYSSAQITDIAFDAGYNNQASFNKAFKNQYHCSPSLIRKNGVSKQTHTLNIEPIRNVNMKPTIKEIQAIKVTCAREVGSYQQAAQNAWGRIMKYGYSNRLMAKEVRSIGISHDDPSVTTPEQIRYDACLELDFDIKSEENLFKHVIAGGKHAVFLHKGAYEELQNTYAFIFNTWLPQSDFDIKEKQPCFEIYLNRDPRKTKPENLKTEIYIPLQS
jgi:AraC family transcriptional regulator